MHCHLKEHNPQELFKRPPRGNLSIAAQGLSGTSPRCAPVPAATATENDRRTQLALWVGGRGEIQFAMGNESGKGVILRAGRFQEETWTHLAVSVEGRKVSICSVTKLPDCDCVPHTVPHPCASSLNTSPRPLHPSSTFPRRDDLRYLCWCISSYHFYPFPDVLRCR